MNILSIKKMTHWTKPAALALIAALPAAISSADVTTGQSEGYGLQVDAEILGLISVDVLNATPGQYSNGSAPAPYNNAANDVDLDVNSGLVLGVPPLAGGNLSLLTTDGLLSSSAISDVDGAAGSRTTSGFGQVNGLDLDLVDANVQLLGATTGLDLLNIGSTTINSTSTVSGDYGAFTATGTSVIEDLVININGLDVDLGALLGANGNIDANGLLVANPNTTLIDVSGIVGLNIILNEQILTGDGITSQGIEVNAIHITLLDVNLGLPLVDNALNADIIIGHSQASMTAVPEPGSLALATLGGLTLLRRRRR